jgi:hypothetical protein
MMKVLIDHGENLQVRIANDGWILSRRCEAVPAELLKMKQPPEIQLSDLRQFQLILWFGGKSLANGVFRSGLRP